MAFSFAVTGHDTVGSQLEIRGTFASSGGSTGGDILTGLHNCTSLVLQHTGAAVVASAPVVNETFPVAGGAMTIVTVADASGIWIAKGV